MRSQNAQIFEDTAQVMQIGLDDQDVVQPSFLTLSYFAPGDTNIFAGPAEQHNVALAIEQGSMIP